MLYRIQIQQKDKTRLYKTVNQVRGRVVERRGVEDRSGIEECGVWKRGPVE